MVVACPPDVQARLSSTVSALAHYPELACTAPDNYHVTIATLPITTTESQRQRLRQVCTAPLAFTLLGMHVRPLGVAINAYSPDNSLFELRKGVARIARTELDPHDRLAGQPSLYRSTTRQKLGRKLW